MGIDGGAQQQRPAGHEVSGRPAAFLAWCSDGWAKQGRVADEAHAEAAEGAHTK